MSLPEDSINIREAAKSDAEMLAALHRQCFPNYWQHEAFTDFFSVRGTFGLVIEASSSPRRGEGIAMVVYRVLYEQADIITLAVHPDFRRRGIARNLLERAIAHAAVLGAKTLFLDVEEGNQAALQLYETFRFSVINRRKHYYRQKDGSFTDALVMVKKLR